MCQQLLTLRNLDALPELVVLQEHAQLVHQWLHFIVEPEGGKLLGLDVGRHENSSMQMKGISVVHVPEKPHACMPGVKGVCWVIVDDGVVEIFCFQHFTWFEVVHQLDGC